MHSCKRQKRAADTPLALYKQAVKLVRQQPCGDTTNDASIQDKLERAVQLAQHHASDQQSGATVAHSLDLDLQDEPLFLQAATHLQLGLLFQRQDKLQEAQRQLRLSLRHFPRFVAAHSALGQVLKAAAGSQQDLQQAQEHLQQAIDSVQQLAEQEGGLLVVSNKACAEEQEAADAARAALAMLLCQSGRQEEAAAHLKALGFKYRLSQQVLQYHIPQPATPPTAAGLAAQPQDQPNRSCSFMQVIDHALPQQLLSHLQDVFRPGADFWGQHAYGRVDYFSYFFQLGQGDTASSMHQLAAYLQQLGQAYFPDLRDARYAEFWAHCRRHSSGHQLHFDSDDEGQGGVRHPIITAIVYLSDNTAAHTCTSAACAACASGPGPGSGSSTGPQAGASCQQPSWVGGPTLMTDQVLGGPLATQGWLAYPSTNRVVLFDGRFLHGVVPGRGPEPSVEGRRCTLMMAFWRQLQCRTPPGTGVGACMPLPAVTTQQQQQECTGCDSTRTWHLQLQPLPGDLSHAAAVPVEQLQHVSAVWQSVDGGDSTSGAAYQHCFQGF